MPTGTYDRKPRGPYKKRAIDERFWEKVDKRGEDECWEWKGAKYEKGYGAFGANYITRGAHVIAYELTNGSVPDGFFVLHKCDNPPCCNPSHLFTGTNQDNVNDMMRKGRHVKAFSINPNGAAKGDNHYKSILRENDIREIRRIYSLGELGYTHIASMFGVKASYIRSVIKRKNWKHVT